jgi:hypothetical protein
MNEPKVVLMNNEVVFAGTKLHHQARAKHSSGMAMGRLFSPFLFGRDKGSWSAGGTKAKVTST